MNMMKPLIQPQELRALLTNPALVLIDARTGPGLPEKYQAQHLPGALWVDLDLDLADVKENAAEGGRHPLPEVEKFAALLGQLGITPQSHVVVYDDKNGANAAARFWWMLAAVGHTQVQVLDGGLDAALAAGIPTSSAVETPKTAPAYPAQAWQLPQVELAQVEAATQDPAFLIIDVRDAVRYRGEHEPIDTVAGHIPNAVNIPLTSNLQGNGFFLAPEALKEKYTAAIGGRQPDQVIVHCGSGVTACHTLLAMAQAGLEIPNLYVGSWSEWSRNGKTIATGA